MQVVWKPQASERLEQVAEAGRTQFGERATARFIQNIIQCARLLAAHPYLGPIEPCLSHLPTPYRSLVVHRHYKLIYCVDEAGEEVTIIALWDTRRNPLRMPQDV